MSKIIKASQITGKYKIENQKKSLSIKYPETESKVKAKAENDNNKCTGQNENINRQGEKNYNLQQCKKNAQKEAAQIIAQAEKKAAEIIEAAENKKREIEAEKEKIFSEIKAEAEAAGYKEAQEKTAAAAEKLLLTAEKFKDEIKAEKAGVKKDIVNLAVKIASIIIDVKLEQEPEIINNIVVDMLSQIDESHKNVSVRINSELIPFLKEKELYSRLKEKGLKFRADPELKKGDCIIETSLGGKEGSLAHKIELIKEELLKEVEADV